MRYAIVAVFLLACGGYVWRVEAQLRQIRQEHEVNANQLVHEYKSNGVVITVTTTRSYMETKREWMDRHLSEIQASWIAHPPDGE